MDSLDLKYFISFLVGLGTSPLFILIPLYAKELGATDMMLSVVVASFFAASMLSYFIFGRYSDVRAVRKALVVAGLLLLTITLALHYFANTIDFLLLIRFISGITAGVYTGPMLAYMSANKEYRTHLSSFYGFGSLGWAFGFFICTSLLKYFSFTEIFSIFSIPVFIAFLLSTQIKKEKLERIEVPLIPIALIKRNFSLYTSFFIRHISAHAIFAFLPIFLLFLGAPKELIGPLFALNPIVQFFVMNSIPKLKWGSRAIFRAGFLLSTISFFVVALSPNYYFILIPMVLIGIGWSFLSVGANLVLIERNIEKATVTGLLWGISSLALIIGPIMGGALVVSFGLREMIFVASAISFFALVIEVLLKKK
ncbi:TPA: MFS transporter [archaeon]|nr:MFS transporter [Candidatus Naiadarchaeales archaeon SRR2090153.bin1042]